MEDGPRGLGERKVRTRRVRSALTLFSGVSTETDLRQTTHNTACVGSRDPAVAQTIQIPVLQRLSLPRQLSPEEPTSYSMFCL
jgi:hypothetical protein